jgi:hypothetical protein
MARPTGTGTGRRASVGLGILAAAIGDDAVLAGAAAGAAAAAVPAAVPMIDAAVDASVLYNTDAHRYCAAAAGGAGAGAALFGFFRAGSFAGGAFFVAFVAATFFLLLLSLNSAIKSATPRRFSAGSHVASDSG